MFIFSIYSREFSIAILVSERARENVRSKFVVISWTGHFTRSQAPVSRKVKRHSICIRRYGWFWALKCYHIVTLNRFCVDCATLRPKHIIPPNYIHECIYFVSTDCFAPAWFRLEPLFANFYRLSVSSQRIGQKRISFRPSTAIRANDQSVSYISYTYTSRYVVVRVTRVSGPHLFMAVCFALSL